MNALLKARSLGILAILVALVLGSAVGAALAQTEEGIAHHYADKFEGKKTASGEIFDKTKLTAAHKKLAFGTKVKVTNVENNKSVVVTVNDRRGGTRAFEATRRITIDISPNSAVDLLGGER